MGIWVPFPLACLRQLHPAPTTPCLVCSHALAPILARHCVSQALGQAVAGYAQTPSLPGFFPMGSSPAALSALEKGKQTGSRFWGKGWVHRLPMGSSSLQSAASNFRAARLLHSCTSKKFEPFSIPQATIRSDQRKGKLQK